MAKITKTILTKIGLYNFALKIYFKLEHFKNWCSVYIGLPILKRSAILRKIHYLLFSSLFNHEAKMFVYARHNYLSKRKKNKNPILLRRQIHKIEKGLMHNPRKPIFGLSYIKETVDVFANLSKDATTEKTLLDWSYDVLVKYFSVVSSHPKIDAAKEKFTNCNYNKISTIEHIPYVIKEFANPNSFEEVIRGRKSVRWFKKDEIPPRDIIDKAVELATLAPSSCNRQSYEFRIFDDPKLSTKIASLAPGAKEFSKDVPITILVNGKMNVSPSNGDIHLMYVDASLAAMNLMNALYSLGVDSCAINWPDIPKLEKALRKEVDIEEYSRPVMMIIAGYAKENSMVACSTRKSVEEIRIYNR